MKDVMSVLGSLTGRSGRYSAVNTNDVSMPNGDNVYNPTTTSAQHQEHPNSQSLDPSIAVFDRFLHGRLGQKKERKKWILLTMLCGMFALTFGSLLIVIDPYHVMFNMILSSGMLQKARFSDGSETFEMWRDPPIELILKVYLFNVTNRDEYMSGKDEKLRFQQVGPYAYREGMSHANVTFNDNGTMSSIPLHPLTYVSEYSNGTEEDILILPNIALLSISHLLNDATFFKRVGLNILIRQTNSQPLVKMTAREFMFGYKSTILSLGNKFMPSWISFDKLGLIDRMYDFKGDTSTTYTGMTDLTLSGLIENYNGLPYLPQWEGSPCNIVNTSSDGTKFNSLIKPNDTLRFFRKSLCRSVPLIRVGEEFVNGLPGYRYKFQHNALDNGVFLEENQCFCRKGNCLPAGLIDVTDCYYGFPIALSYPHFMEGNPTLVEAVEGVKPDPKIHSTYFIVNPESGLPLKLSVKMQINMALGDLRNMANVQRFSHMVLPMLWTNIYFTGLPTGVLTRFYIYLRIAPIAQTLFTYLFLIGGVAFILLSLASAFCIPKDMKHSDTNNIWRDDALRQGMLPKDINKKKSKDNTNNAKEMEVYYCSLLTPSSDKEESDETLERLTSEEYEV